MWISGFCLRAATLFYPQPDVWKEEVFHRLCEQLWGKVFALTFTQLISPQSTGAVEFFQGAKFLDAGWENRTLQTVQLKSVPTF